ncbi:MAG: alpha-glucan family phosphorylase, partial [Campylobacterota bacterium]
PADVNLSIEEQDRADNKAMMDILEDRVIPTYYNDSKKWVAMMKNSISDTIHQFNSDRMVSQYYDFLYNG